MMRFRSLVAFVAIGIMFGLGWQVATRTPSESLDASSRSGGVSTAETSSADAPTPAPDTTTSGMVGFEFSPLLKLDEIHVKVLDEGLSLSQAMVVEVVEAKEDDASLLLSMGDPIWQPANQADGDVRAGAEVLVSTGPIGESTVEQLRALKPDAEVIAIVARSGELLAIAELGGETGILEPSELTTTGPFFLGRAANELLATGYDPVPDPNGCLPPEDKPPRKYTDALDALEQYFVLLDRKPISQRVAATEEMMAIADKIALENATLKDPVLGEPISPSLNDLEHQLASGVKVEDLVIRPAIPIGVIVPNDPESTDIVQFRSSGTGRLLGWMGLSPGRTENEDGTVTALTEFILEISPPDNKEDLAVIVGSFEDPVVFCDAKSGGDVAMTISYDEWAGSRRVNIDLGVGRVTPLHNLDLGK